ncbi:MAG: hypothetical protein FK732_02215 [Asgard group archaeon]|nr:hypothetical protein [Asgard group archaeon]
MKKSKLIATILFTTMFSGMLIVDQFSEAPTFLAQRPIPVNDFIAMPDWVPKPLGNNGTFFEDITALSIIEDGSLDDWAGATFDIINGYNVSVGYDANEFFVAVTWEDSSYDNTISYWNKTAYNTTSGEATWDFIDGEDDTLTIGFQNGSDYDLMTWCASIRGDIYEHNGTFGDTGTLPFLMNSNVDGDGPVYGNDTNPINEASTPNGSLIQGWFDDSPTGSQAGTKLGQTWNASGNDMYVLEFSRYLLTSESDDIHLDFVNDEMYFMIGGEDKDDCLSMHDTILSSYLLHDENEAASLTLNTIPNDGVVEDSFLISGTVYDDYTGWELIVYLSGWEETYGPGVVDDADVNLATGNWSYSFSYDEEDMPLGDHEIWVEFYPLYDDAITIYQNVTFEDNVAPQSLGLVDLHERYPSGVYISDNYNVEVTIGVSDNYDNVDNLTANLFYWKDADVALGVPMVQFSPGSPYYSGNITVETRIDFSYNYTYFAEIWDLSNNKKSSEYFWFIVRTATSPVPGFGFISAIVGLLGASFIIYKKFK